MQNKPIEFDLEQYGGYATLKCPVCGRDNVSPTSVGIVGGIGNIRGIGTRVDASGTAVFAAPVFERGVEIELTFWCECRHGFAYSLRFHKGQTLVKQHEYPCDDGSVIWRD